MLRTTSMLLPIAFAQHIVEAGALSRPRESHCHIIYAWPGWRIPAPRPSPTVRSTTAPASYIEVDVSSGNRMAISTARALLPQVPAIKASLLSFGLLLRSPPLPSYFIYLVFYICAHFITTPNIYSKYQTDSSYLHFSSKHLLSAVDTSP